ncbi:ABC transporter substrate-binding protein [Clostridium sp. SHJSY1]|uniref:ABC transporter substrate-binding protein n=1 Tax=Clostridium sp. SHJSY1 TaxID=2942483 RepID=UPI0028746FDA|nr:ABC transporter substrate-binding protein [Clostridium sp. SHJSY1]MDS0524378.1 ABC transporter substrate-binding protein [Clostridium sp. SHJSY1]
MKNFFKFLVSLVVIINLTTSVGYTLIQLPNENNIPMQEVDRLQKIKEKGELTVASSNDVPFAYINPKTSEFTGIDADIMKEAARRLGINKVKMKEVPFDQLLNQLNVDEDIDIIADGMYVTEERKKLASFTNILYKESEAIITPKVSKIIFKEDLKNAKVGIGALKGTVYSDLAKKWEKDGSVKNVITFNNQKDLLNAVNTGKIDAAITDSIVASYFISQDPKLYLKISSVKEYTPETPGRIAAAVRKSDVNFLKELNKAIDDMKEDLTILKILRKYGLDETFIVPVKDGHISN